MPFIGILISVAELLVFRDEVSRSLALVGGLVSAGVGLTCRRRVI